MEDLPPYGIGALCQFIFKIQFPMAAKEFMVLTDLEQFGSKVQVREFQHLFSGFQTAELQNLVYMDPQTAGFLANQFHHRSFFIAYSLLQDLARQSDGKYRGLEFMGQVVD